MNGKKKNYIIRFIVLLIIAILVFIDIPSLVRNMTCLTTLKNNLYWLERMLDTFTPLLIVFLIAMFIIWAKTHLSITITSCSIGGVEVSLKNIEDDVKNNVRNFLNTKRSLFKIYPEFDNFYDVLNSYHVVYEFLRSQLTLFTLSNEQKSDTYKVLQDMLKDLNCFLTKYQSDYRRWYEKENEKDFIPLSELQRTYKKYDEIVAAFKDLNTKMELSAHKFGVDTFLSDDLTLEQVTIKAEHTQEEL